MWQSPEYSNVAAIQRVGLCDTVSVYFTDLGVVAEKMEVVRVVFDVLSERFEEMELGKLSKSYVAIDNGTVNSTSSQTQNINRLSNSLVSVISGKKVSIIGDSISTFDQDGFNISGYAMYYPSAINAPDVVTVNDTWWKKVIDAAGSVVEVNASYSGSTAAKYDTKPSFYERCGSNVIGNPDTILVELGTNDANHSITVGELDYDTPYTSLTETEFCPAYIKGIKALQANFPNAQIICVILNMTTAYSRAIQRIAIDLGCHYVIINDYERATGSHPNAHGMRQIASAFMSMQDWNPGTSNNKQRVSPEIMIEGGNLIVVDPNYKRGVAPNSNYSSSYISFRDKNNTNCTYIRNYYLANKTVNLGLSAVNNESGSNVTNTLYIGVDASGNQIIQVSDSAAWRRALGLTYAKNDTFATLTVGSFNGYVTSSTKTIYFMVVVDKSLEDISTISVTQCIGAIRGVSGYVDGSSSSTDWTTGYTIATAKVSNHCVRIAITKSTAFTNVTNNTTLSADLDVTLKFT